MSSGHSLKLTPSTLSRRDFLRTSAVISGSLMFGGCVSAATPKSPRLKGAGSKLNIACFGGGGGKGRSDLEEFSKLGENIMAIVDVDLERANKTAGEIKAKHPDVKIYSDYRKCLEELGGQLDACTVSTPDHMHAPISMAAMERGLHVYCQKPLTWCVGESREMKRLAREMGVITQMGNQGSGHDSLRRGVELVQTGVIGEVKELQAWTNRPVWPQGLDRPEGSDPIPETLKWDLWLGVAPERPYKKGVYHSFNWRGWKDFGGGALADMACHLLNFPFRALKMGYPSSVIAENSDNHAETFPKNAQIVFEFPAREGLPPLKMVWREGGSKPNPDEVPDVVKMQGGQLPNNGVVLIGTKGVIYQADDYGNNLYIKLNGEEKLVSIAKHAACTEAIVPVTIARSGNNYKEWAEACKVGGETYSRFDIAGFLTESILVGTLAQRFDKQKLEWDGLKARCTNVAAANDFVNRKYRKGW